MVRFAEKKDLARVNELRKQVNDIHTKGRPDIFKLGFSEELRNYIFEIWNDENKDIIVAEKQGVICGFAVLNCVDRHESPYMNGRRFLDVDEFGVDKNHRREGIATDMMVFIKDEAKKRGINRLELNMWEFNDNALAFYEAVGFRTYRRYMEMEI